MKELGMSWDEIMWKRSWTNIEMMLADASRLGKQKPRKMTGADIFKMKSNG